MQTLLLTCWLTLPTWPAPVPSSSPVPLDMPSRLQCAATQCVFGEAGTCDPDDYFPAVLEHLDRAEGPTWHGESGLLRAEELQDRVTLDFGVGAHGGDQTSVFTFLRRDLQALHRGERRAITGLYEDGYDWADGYHTRALFTVRCQ